MHPLDLVIGTVVCVTLWKKQRQSTHIVSVDVLNMMPWQSLSHAVTCDCNMAEHSLFAIWIILCL